MKFILNKRSFNPDDTEGIIRELSLLDRSKIDANTIREIIKVFKYTDDYALIDTIALIFADVNDIYALQSMIEKLSEIKMSGHNSTVIYACSEYDCGKYVLFFSELMLASDYHAMLEILSVLKAVVKPIKLSDKIIAMKKLSNFHCQLKIEDEKYDYICHALAVIESLPTN